MCVTQLPREMITSYALKQAQFAMKMVGYISVKYVGANSEAYEEGANKNGSEINKLLAFSFRVV